jgi:hypothetical protein
VRFLITSPLPFSLSLSLVPSFRLYTDLSYEGDEGGNVSIQISTVKPIEHEMMIREKRWGSENKKSWK